MTRLLLLLGRLEAISFLLLLLSMPLKYFANWPFGVKLLGPLHGFLFLGYCAWALWCALEQKWPFKQHVLAYISAIVPFGTLVFEAVYLKKAPRALNDKRATANAKPTF